MVRAVPEPGPPGADLPQHLAGQYPTVDHSVSGAWQLASLSRLITPWWIAWWTSNLVGRIASTQLRSDNPDTVLGGLRTLVAGDALEIVAAVLLIVLVRQLSARQTSRMATVPV